MKLFAYQSNILNKYLKKNFQVLTRFGNAVVDMQSLHACADLQSVRAGADLQSVPNNLSNLLIRIPR